MLSNCCSSRVKYLGLQDGNFMAICSKCRKFCGDKASEDRELFCALFVLGALIATLAGIFYYVTKKL
jgi:hypothetical protein